MFGGGRVVEMSSGEYESVFDMIAIPGGGSGTLQDGGTGGEKIWWVRGVESGKFREL